MAKFCDGCKVAGNCQGEISVDDVAQRQVTRERGKLFRSINALIGNSDDVLVYGTYTVVLDTNGDSSEIISAGPNSPAEVIKAIGDCATGGGDVCGAFPRMEYAYEKTVANHEFPAAQLNRDLMNQIQSTRG